MKPLVSVVIPVYNHPDWLRTALQSALSQTYPNLEVIVVDDGSTDDISCIEELSDARVAYYKNKNQGVAYSRNFGISKASGKYVAFLDSDDFWKKEKLEVQIAEMEKRDAVWSQHNYYYFDDKQKKIIKKIDTYKYRANTFKYFYTSFRVQTSCFVVRRQEILENNISFPNGKKYGEDGEFYYQLLVRYPLLCIDQYLGCFRIRGTNAGKNAWVQLCSRAEGYEKKRDDTNYQKYASLSTKLANRYCFSVVQKYRKDENHNSVKYKFLYAFPWMIYRLNSFWPLQ